MGKILILLSIMLISGCATVTPYKELNLDTTSDFNIGGFKVEVQKLQHDAA